MDKGTEPVPPPDRLEIDVGPLSDLLRAGRRPLVERAMGAVIVVVVGGVVTEDGLEPLREAATMSLGLALNPIGRAASGVWRMLGSHHPRVSETMRSLPPAAAGSQSDGSSTVRWR